jgi:cytochrome c553
MSRPVSAAAAALSVLVFASAAVAQTPAKPARLGLCASCHGESGRALMKGTPHLAGQDLDYLKSALAAYRSGARDVAVMRAAVGALSLAELDDLAAWYAAQPAAQQTVPP